MHDLIDPDLDLYIVDPYFWVSLSWPLLGWSRDLACNMIFATWMIVFIKLNQNFDGNRRHSIYSATTGARYTVRQQTLDIQYDNWHSIYVQYDKRHSIYVQYDNRHSIYSTTTDTRYTVRQQTLDIQYDNRHSIYSKATGTRYIVRQPTTDNRQRTISNHTTIKRQSTPTSKLANIWQSAANNNEWDTRTTDLT